jgi:hypothetical protein
MKLLLVELVAKWSFENRLHHSRDLRLTRTPGWGVLDIFKPLDSQAGELQHLC